jgi:hypothetical protein
MMEHGTKEDVGVGPLIEFEIISTYCHVCSLMERTLSKESPEYFFAI